MTNRVTIINICTGAINYITSFFREGAQNLTAVECTSILCMSRSSMTDEVSEGLHLTGGKVYSVCA